MQCIPILVFRDVIQNSQITDLSENPKVADINDYILRCILVLIFWDVI
jgi:hypothetical protein